MLVKIQHVQNNINFIVHFFVFYVFLDMNNAHKLESIKSSFLK